MTVSCGSIIVLQFAVFEECWQFDHFGVLTAVVLARGRNIILRSIRDRSEWSQEITTCTKQNLGRKVEVRRSTSIFSVSVFYYAGILASGPDRCGLIVVMFQPLVDFCRASIG